MAHASPHASPHASVAARRPRREVARGSHDATLWRTAFLVTALLVWEVLARTGVINEDFSSKPSSVAQAVGPLLSDSQVAAALGVTLYAVAMSFVIGTAAGMVVGVVLGLQPLLRQAYFPIIMMLLGSPKSLFLPIIMLFFGLGAQAAIVFGSILTFVHVTVNVVAGVDLIEPKHLVVAKAFGASRWSRFVHVILPGASPGLFTAIWHGLRNGFTGVVITQLFTATAGIGYLVRVYSNNFQTDRALTLVLLVSVVLILVGTAWNRLEKHLTRWRADAEL
jgi:ABC-type nitrate/sulfonate/bicarbonate transport system permease component